MKTIIRVEIKPVFVDTVPPLHEMEEATLYISEKYQTIVHKCLCGCGMQTVTPISPLLNNHWYFVKEDDNVVSLIGSVGNYSFPCKSHYIITKNIANFV